MSCPDDTYGAKNKILNPIYMCREIISLYQRRIHLGLTALMLGRLFSMFTLFFLYCYFDSPCLSVSLLAFKDMMGFSYWSYKKYKKVFFFPFSRLGR